PPYIGMTNIGFAVGVHAAPETFRPEDFTPASEMEWNADLGTPLALYMSAGISDYVPAFNGIVYEVAQSGGVRVDGEIDYSNPSSLTDLQLCGTIQISGGVANISRGLLALVLADKSALSFTGVSDVCYGKIMETNGSVAANLML